MRKMAQIKTLSKLGDIFTVDDVKKISDMNDEVLWVMLHRLETQGWIERIEKGKYMIIPLGAEKGKYTLNEFVIGSMLIEPYCISYWSALHYYGFTEQIPSTVFIQTTSRKKKQDLEVFGVRYKIIKIKQEKFFGIKTEWFDNDKIFITDKEKTIIDCLDRPRYSGGIIEVIKGIKEQSFDKARIADYANQINNTGVIRRLGFLCEYYGIDIELPPLDRNIRNYLPLDPTMPQEGEKSSKWRLILNLAKDTLEDIE
ncbi:MAG: type IV toxin-antitoxin system AbiEi family antitoxin domain-containing protein [Methanogenium sp.]|nr:type IV toxin-antitoxin system AbiEi family antitoxin domain-containing protein [Methanogenium sp.]